MDNTEVGRDLPYQFTVHTFGCKVNTYDTGLIQKNLREQAPTRITGTSVHVLNTCAVTAEATRQAVRLIRKIKAKEPFSTVVVTGCAAQVDTGQFEELPGADLVVANSHKGLLPHLLDQYFKGELKEKVFKSNIFRKEDLEFGGGEELQHTRSFLKIQDGCNSFCSFCIIPYARGKSRSIPISDLVRKITELQQKGVKEVVLTGVHIGDYEDQLFNTSKKLEDLIESILAKTSIPRLRLSSLEPVEISDRMLDLFQDERLCAHFHMSIQSADTDVLRSMKRKYEEKDVRESLQKISNKVRHVFVGMDVIAGFPTETDEQFENTYRVLSETPWTRLHVFPYSERQGTRAAVMPQLPLSLRKERAQKLRELSLHRLQSEALKQIGSVKKSLVLKKEDGQPLLALSRDYWSLNFKQPQKFEVQPNTETLLKVTGVSVANTDVILQSELVL